MRLGCISGGDEWTVVERGDQPSNWGRPNEARGKPSHACGVPFSMDPLIGRLRGPLTPYPTNDFAQFIDG